MASAFPSAATARAEAAPAWDAAAHLRAELELLELRLRLEILRARARRGDAGAQNEFAGLYIPDEEIDAYWLEAGAGAVPLPEGAGEEAAALEERLAERRTTLADNLREAAAAGTASRLSHLREAFDLS